MKKIIYANLKDAIYHALTAGRGELWGFHHLPQKFDPERLVGHRKGLAEWLLDKDAMAYIANHIVPNSSHFIFFECEKKGIGFKSRAGIEHILFYKIERSWAHKKIDSIGDFLKILTNGLP